MDDRLTAAIEMLRGRSRILVFTGAGISTESGIPDFRGPNGVWTRIDPAEFTYDRYVSNPETRRRSWEMRFGSGALVAEPNPAHAALVRLWNSELMIGCVTQNIDGLHGKAGLPPEAVIEVHGSAHGVRCLSCDDRPDVAEVEARWEAGDEDPACAKCGGMLKSTVISFGEAMPQREMAVAYEWAEAADAVVAIGSTLSVYPAAYVPLTVARRSEPFLIVNMGETEHDHLADVKVEAPAGDVIPRLVDALAP